MTKTLEVSPAVKLLTEARRLIEFEGWCQQRLQDESGRYCIYGALNQAEHGHYRYVGPTPPVAQAALFRATGTRDNVELVHWNNAPGRTKEEVLAAFDRAIALELGLEQP